MSAALWAAGLQPVAASDSGQGIVPAVKPDWSGVTKIYSADKGVRLEALTQARPDLLIDAVQPDGTLQVASRLAEITETAPVVGLGMCRPIETIAGTADKLIHSLGADLTDIAAKTGYTRASATLKTAVNANPDLSVGFVFGIEARRSVGRTFPPYRRTSWCGRSPTRCRTTPCGSAPPTSARAGSGSRTWPPGTRTAGRTSRCCSTGSPAMCTARGRKSARRPVPDHPQLPHVLQHPFPRPTLDYPMLISSPAKASRPRRLLTAVAATAMALALAACGSSSSSTTSSGGTVATRAVATAHGKVSVPAHPLRIVSVHSWATESPFDLGIEPVGVENSGENTWSARRTSCRAPTRTPSA